MCGHAQDVDMTSADLDHEEHVQPTQGDRAVDVEEIACQHGRGLRAQELPSGGPGPLRRGRYPQPFQHPSNCGGPDPVAQAEQLALDPLVAQPGFSRAICSISNVSRHRPAGVLRG